MQLSANPWIAACQAFLSFTISRICSNSGPLSWRCYVTISSSAAPFSFCLQSFLAPGSFLISWLFTLGGQNVEASVSTLVLPMNIQGWLPFSTVTQSCPTLCNPMDCSTPGFPVHHQLPELAQTDVHWVSDAIQPSHPLSSPSPPAFNLSQHQSLFPWVSSLHYVAKVLELKLQHQYFQWVFKTDFL